MPFSPSDPPAKIRKLSEKKQRQCDVIGVRFGRLTVEGKADGYKWKCRCDCGTEKDVDFYSLKSGDTKSCGCLRRMVRKDIIGERFGRLVVVRRDTKYNYWICLCDCGKEKGIFRGSLTSGKSVSCGCSRFDGEWIKRGVEHHSWKPELSMDDRLKNDKHYGLRRGWSRDVFSRDDWTCQKCGKKGGYLHAHHIESWASCDRLRNEVGNGVTTCVGCHWEFHRIYGKGRNTRLQWDEYVREVVRCAV